MEETAFCRDCFTRQDADNRRCIQCASPRLVSHSEVNQLGLAHIDCDAFYASIEKRDRPELADKPVIVGGGKRGVVSTACYIARIHGVRSAMPMFKALKACPDAVTIKPDMKKYAAASRQIRKMMTELTPLVEPISIDEAFLDLSGTERLHGEPSALTLARLAQRIEHEVGITVSVGLSYCKFLAKVASDLNKPRGFSVLGRGEAVEFLASQPVTLIWGVGKAFAATLRRDGIRTIGQLQKMEQSTLVARYGSIGDRLYHLARGKDTRRLKPQRGAKSISNETTFFEDRASLEVLLPVLRRLCESVSHRLKKAESAGKTVTLKLKTADFKSRTRSQTLSDPTQLADRIFWTASDMLKNEVDGTAFRLIGVGVSELVDPHFADPPSLLDPKAHKRALAEAAMDKVRGRFGRNVLETGVTFESDDKRQ